MKNCIMLWKNDAVDLAINNQRRAFSDAYNNEVLAESKICLLYTSEELAASHGIRNYAGVVLHLEDLQKWSDEILGDCLLYTSRCV